MLCKICQKRKPRRYCPGILADICSQCCGNEREVTVNCPLDCEYLRESRLHEKYLPVDPKTFPNADIKISEAFVAKNQQTIVYTGMALGLSIRANAHLLDSDLRESLDALTRTYRTLVNGLYYESTPANPYAAEVAAFIRRTLKIYQEEHKVRDSDLLGVLVFFEGIAISHNTGRPKSRSFIDFVLNEFREKMAELPSPLEESPRLIEL